MRKGWLCAALILTALLLCGCGNDPAPGDAPPTAAPPTFAPAQAPSGPAAEAVNKRLAPYQAELSRVAAQSGASAAYTVPEEMLEQMSRDAAAAEALPAEGFWRFTVREAGSHTYQFTAMDVYAADPSLLSATPDPDDEAPQDRQLMGDYDVSGGGEFIRTRAYAFTEDLSSGTAELTDTLNGETTGHELFSFALRDGRLYFVDAAMDLTAGLDGLENTGRRLMAVGYLAEGSLDVMEYEAAASDPLPDPASLDYAALLSAVTPLTRVSDQNGRIILFP